MNWDEMESAVRDAAWTMKQVDRRVSDMARMISHRLRAAEVDRQHLRALKRELQDFDARTGRWK